MSEPKFEITEYTDDQTRRTYFQWTIYTADGDELEVGEVTTNREDCRADAEQRLEYLIENGEL